MRRMGISLAACTLIALVMTASPDVSAGDYYNMLSGVEAEKRIERLTTQIQWHRNLEEALAEAKKTDKPVFWLQLVGDLDDGL